MAVYPWPLAVEAAAGENLPVALGPATVVQAPPAARAAGAFVGVLALGALLVTRYGPVVDRGVAATLDRPAVSVGYGVATHLVIAFAALYLGTRVAESSTIGVNPDTVAFAVVVVLVGATGVVGFTVLGATALELWGARPGLGAPLAGAVLAALVVALDPATAPWLWLAAVSVGIGGPVRRWVNASLDEELRG